LNFVNVLWGSRDELRISGVESAYHSPNQS
jgi:hypothetical protein